MRSLIHRSNVRGGALCGAWPARISCSGVMISCPECAELCRMPTHEESLRQLQAVADEYRQRKRSAPAKEVQP